MKKILVILMCMLVTVPVVTMATGQNTTTRSTHPLNERAIIDVTIADFFFSPTPVTIAPGDTVRWTNNGPAPHSSTSDTGLWDSGVLSVGQNFSHTFATTGTFNYHCSVHPTMHGSVVVTSGNLPPSTPSKPTGPTALNVSESGNYSTSATDPNGDQVQYMFDWDATGAHDFSPWSSLVPSGTSVTVSHAWNATGTYVVEAQARDSNGATSSWSSGLTVMVTTAGNLPPNTPLLTGPSHGKAGATLSFTATATDPENENVAYFFDWGDGTNSGWTTYVASGTATTKTHSWSMKATYTVKVKAKDINNLESAFATLTLTVPRARSVNVGLFDLLERFPNAFPILRYILTI